MLASPAPVQGARTHRRALVSRTRDGCVANAVKIRQGTVSDIGQIAVVCKEAFGTGNFPGVDNAQISQIEERYSKAIDREVREKVLEAMERKTQAACEHREYRLRRSAMLMRAQLAVIQGGTAVFPVQPSPEERRQVERWLRSRQYMCLVAEDSATGQLVGTVTLTLAQPEALLPPPFPSAAPTRLYVCNMAVRERWRRQGVARALLHACMRVASLWDYGSLWLHVRNNKVGALRLYTREGFTPPQPSGPLPTVLALMGEVLLQRSVAKPVGRRRAAGKQGQAGLQDAAVASALEAAWAERSSQH